MEYDGPVELLVTGEAGSLPDPASTQRHFSWYGQVDHVKDTDEGLLVTISTSRTAFPLLTAVCPIDASREKHHEVDGHRVEAHLLTPDVYGCEVTVTRHRVSVTVGHEVISKVKQAETQTQFITEMGHGTTFDEGFSTVVSLWSDRIEVELKEIRSLAFLSLEAFLNFELSGWELSVCQLITEFLKPLKEMLPQSAKQTSYRERCLDQKYSKQTSQSKDLDTHDGDAIVGFGFPTEDSLHLAASEISMKQLHKAYPSIDINCNTDMKTLTLQGPARATLQAKEEMCSRVRNLTTERITLDQWQIQVLKNPDARMWIQRTLDRKKIMCYWKILDDISVVSAIAPEKDQPHVQQVFQSSFCTTEVSIGTAKKSALQSDEWKICLEGLKSARPGESAPIVEVQKNNIVIHDFAAYISSVRRAVIVFFYNNYIQTCPEFCDQEVEEPVTELQLWQTKCLTNTGVKERIIKNMQDKVLLDLQSDRFVIKAPIQVLAEALAGFWRFVASLSQKHIQLSTASAKMYQHPASISKVQTLVQEAGLACTWEVEDGHITVSAEDAYQKRLKQIFTSAFTEARVPVAPEKSHLLRSEDFQALVTELQERKSGSSTPVVQTSPGDNCVIIVDASDSCATVQRAVEKFFEDHEVMEITSQKETQTQSPQHEHFGAQTEVDEIQTESRHQQTGVQNLCSTEQQTDNRQLENKEQQTQDSSGKKQRTKRPMLTENGFQTEKITTKEQQLQIDQSQLESTGQQTEDSENDKRLQTETRQTQSNETQLRKENTNSETRRTQTVKQQPENQPMQTQREHRQTQTDESENKNHEQSLHERMDTQGTQITSPDVQNKKQASPHTERTPADEEVAPSDQDHQRRMQRSDVQSDSRDCPADHQHHYPRHDNVGTAQYTCQEDMQTGDATQEDSSETFPKYICDPQQGQRNSSQDSATHCGDTVQQQLLCLTVEQLLEVATHLGIGRETLDQLQFGCPAPDDLKRHLTEACRAASDTETLFMAVLRLFAQPAVTGSSENSTSHHRISQTAPLSTADSEHLSATISVEHSNELSVHSQCNQLANGAQLTSSFSTEIQGIALESFAQSDTESACMVKPLLCNPQPLNSVDQVDLLHFTQADPCLFSGMSTTSDLQGSESSTSSGHYTPVLASMLFSSASSGPLSPITSQQQVTQPAHATRSAQRRSLVDHPQTHDRGNTVASDWHSRVRVDVTNRPGNEASLHAAQPPAMDIESLVQINQRLRQLEALVMQRDQGPHPPPVSADCHARIEAQITQRFHQVELQMLDRLDALVQLRLQSASVADSRVYLSQMRAMEIEMQARMESQLSHLRAQTMTDVRREIDIDVRGVIAVDNASSSSSHSAPPSEASD